MEEGASWLRRRAGWVLSFAVILAPIVIWLLGRNLELDLSTSRGGFIFMAKLCAFGGFAMYAWSLILSGRLRFLERLFLGLDKMLRAHYILGGMSILLITLHPVFLSLARAGNSIERALRMWLPGSNWMLNWGILALFLMWVVTFITYRVRLPHKIFVRIHLCFGLIIIPSMIHAFMASGHMAENPWLRRYMIVLSVLAVLVYFYHTILGRLLMRRYKYVVSKVNRPSRDIVEIVMRRKHWPITFAPGQFAFFSFHDPAVDSEAHPYALSSSNRDELVSATVKNLGDHTAQLFRITPGSTVEIEGPYGALGYMNSKKNDQVWVAGGIGITPFLSMARSLPKRSRRRVDLFYCTKTRSEAVFARELAAIAKARPYMNFYQICEASDGFLTSETIAKHTKGLDKKEFMICGPPPMMAAIKKQLVEHGVDPDDVHTEEFAFK